MSTPQRPSSPSLKPEAQSGGHLRSRSRTRDYHGSPARSGLASYLQDATNEVLLPGASISEEAVELLHEFVHPHHRDKRRADTEATLFAEDEDPEQQVETASESDSDEENDDDEDRAALKKRPWYRRPSPYWLLCTTPFSSIATSVCVAPRIEIYTLLACRQHKPEYTAGDCPHGVDVNATSSVLPITFSGLADTLPINDYQYPQSEFNVLPPIDELVFAVSQDVADSGKCASDPVVQAAAAKIIAVLTTTMGILGCLTTAFWGSLSDKYGRLRVIGISVLGVLLDDFVFIFVFFFSKQLPGGYWFLLLGPIVEGTLGGMTTMVATVHAYIADATPPSDRSRQFSLGGGLLFVGMAIGPTIGSILIRETHTPITVFYLASAIHALIILYVWVVVPESIPKAVQKANRERAQKRRLEETRAEDQAALVQATEGDWKVRCLKALGRTKVLFSFLSPLGMFAPVTVENAPRSRFSKKQRDWSLTLIAMSFGFSAFVMSSYQYKFQYAAATFGWSSEELGYWLSLVGATRAAYLTLVLPFVIKLFNKPKKRIQPLVERPEPLISGSSEPSSSDLTDSSIPPSSPALLNASHPPTLRKRSVSPPPPATLAPHSANFDLGLSRFSLAWEAFCFALIPLAPTAGVFSVMGCLAALGGGFHPAVQALALETYVRRRAAAVESQQDDEQRGLNGKGKTKKGEADVGRLFGAMSVVQTMCSQIFGPPLFGIAYAATIATHPTTIFWLSTLCVSLALIFMLLVHLPQGPAAHGVHIPGHISPEGAASTPNLSDTDLERAPLLEREETLVGASDGLDGTVKKRK